jgi:nucleotide-binding universal stress UspA family protein
MNRVKNILTCLDLTYIDSALVEYTAFFAKAASAEKAHFLHVIQTYDLPDKGGRDIPDEAELYRLISRKTEKEVDAHFRKHFPSTFPIAVKTLIESEDASSAIIDFISEMKIDLVLVGQKFGARHEARYGRKIMAGASCDIMFIPEHIKSGIDKILCAIDGSNESETAFKYALDLSRKNGAAIACYFLYDTTEAYFPATTLSSATSQQERFRREFANFLERFSMSPDNIPCHYQEIGPTENQTEKIYDAATDEQADLIITGAAGDIAVPTTLLGNIAENFSHIEKKIPLLIVKNKKTKRFYWL